MRSEEIPGVSGLQEQRPTPRIAPGLRLSLQNVSKVHAASNRGKEVVALSNISFDVPQGQFVAIVGPSGCGKSTLLNLVAGIDRPTSGRFWLGAKEIFGPGSERGLMFQQYALFPWMTVSRNVEFGPKSRGVPAKIRSQIVDELIDLVGLRGFENRYPHELSGGMQQRCALARVLANDPVVLLMDEPLAAVDAQTRNVLQDELLRVWGENRDTSDRKTVLYVTHSIEEAAYLADRIIVMASRPGRVLEDLTNDLPRPRVHVRRSPSFGILVDSIWDLLRADAERVARELPVEQGMRPSA